MKAPPYPILPAMCGLVPLTSCHCMSKNSFHGLQFLSLEDTSLSVSRHWQGNPVVSAAATSFVSEFRRVDMKKTGYLYAGFTLAQPNTNAFTGTAPAQLALTATSSRQKTAPQGGEDFFFMKTQQLSLCTGT